MALEYTNMQMFPPLPLYDFAGTRKRKHAYVQIGYTGINSISASQLFDTLESQLLQ
jgi:hypothetical protein